MTLGERIQTHRKKCALSQEKLAEIVGVSRQAVTKWEADQSAPSVDNLIKLSQIFAVPLDELANGNPALEEGRTDPPTGAKRDDTILMANLTLIATAFIAGASSGLYQSRHWGYVTPTVVWIIVALIGGIVLMIRDRLYYKKFRRQLFGYDLLFILPVFLIPLVPMPFSLPLLFMTLYAITFTMIFIHRKIRPWKWKKNK